MRKPETGMDICEVSGLFCEKIFCKKVNRIAAGGEYKVKRQLREWR